MAIPKIELSTTARIVLVVVPLSIFPTAAVPAVVAVVAAESAVLEGDGVGVAVGVVEDTEDDLAIDSDANNFASPSTAVAFFQLFSLALNMHKTSSWFPPATTTNPLGSSASAKVSLVAFGASVELYEGQVFTVSEVACRLIARLS